MSKQFEKMVTLLKELFQLDQPDLDFGLYRVMHAKSGEITQFLEQDLLPQVKMAFGQYTTADKAELEKELKKAIEQANELGVDPETTAKVQELRQKIADESVDVSALENEVYDYLFSFFRRYYHEGDFLSKRVYKPGVYAIPYEGEEVKLHWANRDQYYIKTSEYLRDYAFTLRPSDATDPMRVHFHLADVSEGEHGNVKAAEGKGRIFILANDDLIAEEDGELVIRFHYRPATMNDWSDEALAGVTATAKKKPPVQKELLLDAVRRIFSTGDQSLKRWLDGLSKAHEKANGEVAEYSRLQGHLDRYFKRNTFDYFIHKDLGRFLRQELDFYIKNEVMHLDDVESERALRVEQYLSKIKVIRKIAHKLIDFLAQLEDFQKKLWLKKKFVVETNYCIALDRISEEFYPEIAENDAQLDEWIRLLAIDEIEGDLDQPGYTNPLTMEFLKTHPTLLVDTRFLKDGLASRILASIHDLEKNIDALLIDGENLHALRLLSSTHREKVNCIYIDPPYNTGGDGFMYRDNYRHSSWLSMISDRLSIAQELMAEDAVLFASIDANERTQLEHSLSDTFGAGNRVEEIIWVQNTTKNRSPTYSTNHEYVEVYAKNKDVAKSEFRRFRETKPGLSELQELLDEINPLYPSVKEIEDTITELYKANKRRVKSKEEADESAENWKGLYNYAHAEYRDETGKLVDQVSASEKNARIWIWRESDTSMPQVKEDSQKSEFRDENDPEFRFYTPVHPIVGKPCPAPKRGWAWPFDPFGRQASSFSELAKDNRIVWGADEKKIPQKKSFVHETETNVSKSVMIDFTDGEKQLANLFGKTRAFSNPKPTTLIQRFIEQTAWNSDRVMDFFAGSGTTGHAVIDANRFDGGRRKIILVEVGEHFENILLPRLKKVTFAPEWKDGKPKRLATREELNRSPRIMKILRLESYEDALNNLECRRSKSQQSLLDLADRNQANSLKEQYLLRYMLDVETRGSQSLLNIAAFNDPTAYRLKVKRPGGIESSELNVDLLETFNYLIGLTVQSISAPQTFQVAFKRDDEGRLRLDGRLRQNEVGPWWFRTVYGTASEGRRTLIIWRKLTGDPEQDNLVLDEWFTRQGYSTLDYEFDMIYVNGDSNLENLRAPDETWKVRLIEEDFHRLMFDTTGL